MNKSLSNKKDITSKNFIKKQIKDLIPGDIILHPIYRVDGLMLIKRNKILSSDIISKINKHAPQELYVLVSPTRESFTNFLNEKEFTHSEFIDNLKKLVYEYNEVLTFPISIEGLIEKEILINQTEKNNEEISSRVISNLKYFYSNPFFSSFEMKLESKRLQERAKLIKLKLIDTILNNEELNELLTRIKEYKGILLIHSINTTSMALMIGLTVELSDDELIDLAICALFSDVGFTDIAKEEFQRYLRNRENKKDIIIKHIESFMKVSLQSELLRKESIVYGVLDRHEYYNGYGIPKRKKHKQISLFGRILSICQAYDEMVGGYFYNDGVSPTEAIKKLWDNREKQFDPDILSIFIHRSTFYKIGETIIISKKLKAEIVGFTDYIESPHLPIVKTDYGKYIDLLKVF